jgi:hypothetical protein
MHNSAKIFNEAKIVIQYLIMMWDREREREREWERDMCVELDCTMDILYVD